MTPVEKKKKKENTLTTCAWNPPIRKPSAKPLIRGGGYGSQDRDRNNPEAKGVSMMMESEVEWSCSVVSDSLWLYGW